MNFGKNGFGLGGVGVGGLTQPIFLPDLFESLLFARVIAKNMDREVLAQPAMHLGEEFPALRLGYLRLGRAFAERAERLEILKPRFVQPGTDRGSAGARDVGR